MNMPFKIFATLVLLHGSLTLAAAPPTPSAAETSRLLEQRAFAKLEQQFGAVQTAYELRKINDETLRAAFRAFESSDPPLAAAYEDWVKKSPNSYVAHLARGIYSDYLGMQRRGPAYASDTSPEQWKGLRDAHAIAAREFKRSIELSRRPLLSYAYSIDIALYGGDDEAARRLLDAAVRIDPKTLVARVKYMGTLRTQWGGSAREMRAFYDECKAAGTLNNRQLGELEAQVFNNDARDQKLAGNLEGAARSYEKEAAANPAGACASCGPNFKLAEMAFQTGQYQKAIDALGPVLAANPDDMEALSLRSDSYLKLGKGELARRDLEHASNLGEPEAQLELGKRLMEGDVLKKDLDAAEKWLAKAAAQGNWEAQVKLEYLRKTMR